MNLIEIFSILGIHWFADFVLQTDEQAKGKSKNWNNLIEHTFFYSIIWFIIGFILLIYHFNIEMVSFRLFALNILLFTLITFICHTVTDYYTSRLNSKLWKQGKVHNFFVSVGFDQYLHYIQLFLTYWYLTK